MNMNIETGMEIAVIGMSGRFPGAGNFDEFWDNLKNGVESITFFSDEELKEAGVTPELIANPYYIKANGVLENIEYFDASFFGYTPREAEIMDPQTRVFHECAWAALEDAGYDPAEYKGLIGLYAGATHNLNWEGRAIFSGKVEEIGSFAARQLTQKDYLNLRISYKLNLMGPSVSLYTACSTSLVAIHQACQAILNGECDMALAGGVSVAMIVKSGYMYQEGMILSPDGHCRAFDAAAKGINNGDGVGVVVLKILEDARQDRDNIYAVIKGSAINNDGIRKAGFTAASVEGQAEVIKMALQVAEVKSESIGYIEAHGTGTELGDPVEIEALKLAFNTNKKAFCAVGSVKTNVGHLDAAAGIASFIKAVLALKYRLVPPSINFEIPNPHIDFINSPFYINSMLSEWENREYLLRAGVSSFGIGGTNAHVILEEAPEDIVQTTDDRPQHQLIILSARTPTALDKMKENLAEYLRKIPEINIADAVYTLQVGRRALSHRWMAVCATVDEIIKALTSPGGGEMYVVSSERENLNPVKTEPVLDRESVTRAGRLWLHGHKIDWKEFYSRGKRNRVSLPTYPFEKQRYWIDIDNAMSKALIEKENVSTPDMADWFYLPTWKRSILEHRKNKDYSLKQRWLVFMNELNLGMLLVKQFNEKKQDVIIVEIGHEFCQVEDKRYSINPEKSDHYDALFKELQIRNSIPDKIVHLWGVTETIRNVTGVESFNKAQYSGFFSLLYMVKALGKQNFKDTHINVLTNNVQEVIGGEPLCPEKSTVLGLLKSIPQEYPGLRCTAIDIYPPEPGSAGETALIYALLEEFSSNSIESVVAYRNNQRWVQIFDPLHLEEVEERDLGFRNQGVYLVTGGLGKIGFMFSELLVNRAGAGTRLILTGRSSFPDRHEWNQWLDAHDASDPVSLKIRQLQRLEEIGAQVLYFQADVFSLEEMQKIVTHVEEILGKINGVIHSAGIVEGDSMRSIQELSDNDCWLQFRAKVYGTLILEELFKDSDLDFCWMLSSISCVLGGLGFGAYASANLFMDVFVKRHNQLNPSCSRWFSLNWDGMEAEKSIALFERMFPLKKVDQLVVSNGGNLHERIEKWIKLESVRYGRESKTANPSGFHPKPDLSNTYVAPRNPCEKAIVDIWQNLLGYDEIGVQDDFLKLGGDSLKAITVISRIHQELNVNVSVTEYFRNPTVEGIAKYIADRSKKDTYASIKLAEKKEYYPLTSVQKRILFLQQLDQGNTSYNIFTAIPLGEDVEKEKMEETFRKLILRHESLRTSFEMIDIKPIQKIHKGVDFSIDYYEVGEEKVKEIIKYLTRPFDLSRPPLFRTAFINVVHVGHVKSSHSVLFFVMHHLVTDGISYEILKNEFMALYSGKELSPLKLQYKDYAEWWNSEEQQELIKRQESYWLKTFSGELPVLKLPTDYERPAVQSFEGSAVIFALNEQETQTLKEIAKEVDATLYMVILAVFNVLLSKLSGQEDIIVGTPLAGRRHADLEGIIGMFINTLSMRNFSSGNKTFKAFLKEVKKRTLEAYSNQEYQFENLVEKILEKRDPARNPIFDVVFNLLSQLDFDGDISEITGPTSSDRIENYEKEGATSQFDINLSAIDGGEKIYFNFEYCTKLFKLSTIERFIEYFKNIVSSLSTGTDKKLVDIEIVTEQEQEDFLTITPIKRY